MANFESYFIISFILIYFYNILFPNSKSKAMSLELGKSMCQLLLKNSITEQSVVRNKSQIQMMIDNFLGCFPRYKYTDAKQLNNLKKKIGKMLSIKAKNLGTNKQNLQRIKAMIFDKMHNKSGVRKVLKIRRNREVYSSDEEEKYVQVKAENDYEQTGPISSQPQPKIKIQDHPKKKKYITYDQDFKQQVCQKAIQKGVQQAAIQYDLSARKITSWLEAHSLNILGKGRKALDPAMQYNMSAWILKKIWNQIPLTQRIIRQKAATMKTIKISFNGSKGWLQKFFLRHVELKSCFDIRNKLQLRCQCANYHRSAFYRLVKDYENLVKMNILPNKLVHGNFQQIIYGKGDHQLLKLEEDRKLDVFKTEEEDLYDYQKIKDIQIPTRALAKIEQKQQQEAEQLTSSQQEFSMDQSEADSREGEAQAKNQQCQKQQQSQSSQKNQESQPQASIFQEDESPQKVEQCEVKFEQSRV